MEESFCPLFYIFIYLFGVFFRLRSEGAISGEFVSCIHPRLFIYYPSLAHWIADSTMSCDGHAHGSGGSCCTHRGGSGYQQSLDEMDFERGPWAAAMEGDVTRLKHLLDRGTSANSRDKYGYTPLVGRRPLSPTITGGVPSLSLKYCFKLSK